MDVVLEISPIARNLPLAVRWLIFSQISDRRSVLRFVQLDWLKRDFRSVSWRKHFLGEGLLWLRKNSILTLTYRRYLNPLELKSSWQVRPWPGIQTILYKPPARREKLLLLVNIFFLNCLLLLFCRYLFHSDFTVVGTTTWVRKVPRRSYLVSRHRGI